MSDTTKDESVKPDTRPLDTLDSYLEGRLRALEEKANIETFKDNVYYPNIIKSEREIGEIVGRLTEMSSTLEKTTRKADSAVTMVNDHDTRMGVQFTAFENRIEDNTRKVSEMSSQFDQIITYIRGQQEAEKDRQVIMQRGQRVFTLAARIIFAIFAGLGGLQAFDQILKVILGGN
jgi:hypothetical protein